MLVHHETISARRATPEGAGNFDVIETTDGFEVYEQGGAGIPYHARTLRSAVADAKRLARLHDEAEKRRPFEELATRRPYPSFLEFLRERVGRNWVIARRTPRIIARYGKDVTYLSAKKYDALQAEWIEAHPATLMAATLPDGETGDIIRAAVARELGVRA